jgi:hypothetical protein
MQRNAALKTKKNIFVAEKGISGRACFVRWHVGIADDEDNSRTIIGFKSREQNSDTVYLSFFFGKKTTFLSYFGRHTLNLGLV